jgi:hypothetical protein
VGSVFALGHLLSLGLLALHPPSGPWPTRFGDLPADGPMFAVTITSRLTYPYYLNPLRMTNNYHFASSRVGDPTIYFEIKLRDDDGKVIKTVKFPDPDANFWVRQRQSLLAQGLGNDMPVQPRTAEGVAPQGKNLAEVEYWEGSKDEHFEEVLNLKKAPKHLVPTGPGGAPAIRPSDFAKTLAHAYVRHLCREYGASKGELIRYSKEAVLPIILFMPPTEIEKNFKMMITLKSNFGEYGREK